MCLLVELQLGEHGLPTSVTRFPDEPEFIEERLSIWWQRSTTLDVYPCAQLRVLIPSLGYVAVAEPLLIALQLGEHSVPGKVASVPDKPKFIQLRYTCWAEPVLARALFINPFAQWAVLFSSLRDVTVAMFFLVVLQCGKHHLPAIVTSFPDEPEFI